MDQVLDGRVVETHIKISTTLCEQRAAALAALTASRKEIRAHVAIFKEVYDVFSTISDERSLERVYWKEVPSFKQSLGKVERTKK